MSKPAYFYYFVLLCGFGQKIFAQEAVLPSGTSNGSQYESYQRDALNEKISLTKYQPIYLLYGDPSSKLQFSFKYQLLQDQQIYFGYSQLIFWDLRQDSRPMHDVNYSPEFFYRAVLDDRVFEAMDFVPWSHRSNGKDGAGSRGYSSSSVRLHFKTTALDDTVKGSLQVSNLFAVEETNQDIRTYFSGVELNLIATQFFPGIFDRGELSARVTPGGQYAQDWQKGGQELGLSFRLGGLRLVPSMYLQYYHGYGESLLDYSVSQSILRAGFIL